MEVAVKERPLSVQVCNEGAVTPESGCLARVGPSQGVLSGYASPLYDEVHGDQRSKETEITNHSPRENEKRRKTQFWWLSFPKYAAAT